MPAGRAPQRAAFRRAAVFGAGRAGRALFHSLQTSNVQTVVVGNRSAVPEAITGVRRARGLAATVRVALEQDADLLFIAVSDDALPTLARQLAKRPRLPPVVAHLSGAYGPEVLAPAADLAELAAFHPLAALQPDRPIPPGTVIGVSAHKASLAQRLQGLATQLQTSGVRLRKGGQAGYHLGASVAANLPVALLTLACAQLRAAGLDERSALVASVGLMRSAVDNAAHLASRGGTDLAEVLTGPVARGDLRTVDRHLHALPTTDLAPAYRALSRELARLADLEPEVAEALKTLLAEPSS